MDIEKLIERLKAKDFERDYDCTPFECGVFGLLDDAATALSTFQAENERLKNKLSELAHLPFDKPGIGERTKLMVENAERFGLAQLHQLRGRVGRGSAQSYCIFMMGKPSKETKQRLQVLEQSNDGFLVAEEDLKLRGPGDLFGIRQSGDLNFKLADIYQDAAILKQANEAAAGFERTDIIEMCKKYRGLREKIQTYTDEIFL